MITRDYWVRCHAATRRGRGKRRRCVADFSPPSVGRPAVPGSVPNLTAFFFVATAASALLWLEGDSPFAALAIIAVVFTPFLIYFLTSSFQASIGVLVAAT